MGTALTETDAHTEFPDASVLEDKLPDCLKAPAILAAFTAVVGLVYTMLSYRPLWYTDLWGHLAYGRWIWEHGALPTTEPLMPLAEGVRFVDTAWLTQVLAYGLFKQLGPTSMQFLYAATIASCVGLLIWRFYSRTQNKVLSFLGFAMFAWVTWQQLLIIRPQLAGFACFVGLLFLLTARRWHFRNWLLVPVLFAAWANLHGSFPVGLGLLACFWLGRMADVVWRSGTVKAVFHDQKLRRYLLLTELAAVAVLLNPYGLGLYAEVLTFASSANLASLADWAPLQLRMAQGQATAVAALALMFVYRLSPRRVSTVEVLLLVGLGASAMWTSRMLLWWAPIAAYYTVLHSNAVWKCWRKTEPSLEPAPRTGLWSVVVVGIAWIFFAFTPFWSTVTGGTEFKLKSITQDYTPIGAVEYLNRKPPQGQIFNSYEWGDYLTWAGPKGLKVFVASHAHLVPVEVWDDYLQIAGLSTGWEDKLSRYSVNTVVVDNRYRAAMISRLERNEEWKIAYRDDTAVVFLRRKPIL